MSDKENELPSNSARGEGSSRRAGRPTGGPSTHRGSRVMMRRGVGRPATAAESSPERIRGRGRGSGGRGERGSRGTRGRGRGRRGGVPHRYANLDPEQFGSDDDPDLLQIDVESEDGYGRSPTFRRQMFGSVSPIRREPSEEVDEGRARAGQEIAAAVADGQISDEEAGLMSLATRALSIGTSSAGSNGQEQAEPVVERDPEDVGMEGPQQDIEQDVDVPMEEEVVLAVRTPTPGGVGHDDGGVMDEMELAGDDAVSEAEEVAAPAISPERKAAWQKKFAELQGSQRPRSRSPESPSPSGTRPIAPLGSATSPRARRGARQGSDDPDQREEGQIWAGYPETRSQRRRARMEEEDELESVQGSSDRARPTPTKRIRRVPARNPLSPTKQGTRAGPDNNTQAGPGSQTRANRAATSAASSPAKSPRRKPKPATSSPAATPTKGKGRATSTKGGRGQAKAEIKPEVKQEPSAGTLLNHAKAKRRQEDPGAVEFLGDERCDTCRSLGASKGGDEPWWGCWRNPNSKKERSCSHCVAVRAKCSFNDEPRHVNPPAAGPSTTGLSQEWVNGLAARLDRAIGGMEVGLGVLNSMAATALGEPANNMLAERIQEFSAVSADLRRGPSGSTAAAAIEVEADDEDDEDEEEEEEEEEGEDEQ
ncbi:hypothetical protein HD553DRAFT_346599 [Filobasidium floriforme]|uniref:uncharacterized protein n=1 Tax=Filobasidium floriforme TaxID=5210 RepID=UPI001E8E01F6|nr:uncharacterized protein HD553DRAFT_346599 [Filobasidium floriforme]KAH8077652.1 hypothetical protein HD553DRAFT_346599 [Filobasidium floriforme]